MATTAQPSSISSEPATLNSSISAQQKSLLDTIQAHLTQAYANARHAEELRRAQLALDRLEGAVVFVDWDRNVKFETARASRLLGDYFGARDGARLFEPIDLWLARSDSELRNATDLPAARRPLVIERPGRRLIIRLFSEPNEHLLVLEEQRTSIDPACVAPLGLTKRQAEVLAYVAMGKTNAEIAMVLNIGRRTVDKLVEQILARLGVENRTSAAAMALEYCTGNAPANSNAWLRREIT
jgi:DNA-binding CsgD family transcriptional regulator